MTTALTIITDALTELGAAELGQDLNAEDAALGLRKLNQIVQRYSNSRLMFPVLQAYSVTLTGAASYTVGPGGTPVTLRPLSVIRATATDSAGLEYPVRVVTQSEWDAIPQKAVTGGPPELVWYQASVTDGVIHVYPKATGYTLNLDAQGLLTGAMSLVTVLTLPEGYETLFTLALADDLAPSFQLQTPPDVRRRLAAAMRAIKRTNHVPVTANWQAVETGSYIERGF